MNLFERVFGEAGPPRAEVPVPLPHRVPALGNDHLDVHMRQVHRLNVAKGWRDKPVSFGEAMAMLHSEVSEAVEEYRVHGLEDRRPWHKRLLRRADPVYQAGPEIAAEFADVYIRLLDDCDRFGVDLAGAYHAKMAKNWARPYRHGNKRL
jgi:hypothetical protein